MRFPSILIVLALAGCGASTEEAASGSSEPTRRQKDSLVADMPVPGAGAVGKALGALEDSERRAQAHDTIS